MANDLGYMLILICHRGDNVQGDKSMKMRKLGGTPPGEGSDTTPQGFVLPLSAFDMVYILYNR